MSYDPNKRARDARLDKEVAEDVARGMAIKATAEEARADRMAARAGIEEARADALATENVVQRSVVRDATAQRDAAIVSDAISREEARNSSFATWLLLGTIAVALLIGAIWFANRPEPVRDTVVINREAAEPAQPANPPVAVQVQPSSTPVPVPVPVPVPQAAPPRERVIERQVPVPVPVPAPAPARTETTQPDRTIIIEGGESGSGGATNRGGDAGSGGASGTGGAAAPATGGASGGGDAP